MTSSGHLRRAEPMVSAVTTPNFFAGVDFARIMPCRGEQDVHSGGSGCGCSAVTLCAHILPKLMRGEWNRVLFVPTGALLSTVSYNEGQSIPGIAHAVMLERMEV